MKIAPLVRETHNLGVRTELYIMIIGDCNGYNK